VVDYNKAYIESFYDYVHPSTLNILYKDEKGESHCNEMWIHNKEEFIELCLKENKTYNCYSPHRKLRGHRCDDNVIELRGFVIDIDNDKDGKKALGFEEYCKKWNINIGAKIKSGGGYHYYIPYEQTTIGGENREEIKSISLCFRQHLLKNNVEVDIKIFDLSRLIRVWGTWNFNKNALCEIVYVNTLSKEQILSNTQLIRSLKNFIIAEAPNIEVFTLVPEASPFMDYISKNKLIKENTYKNDVLIKNIAAYFWATMKEDGYQIGVKITVLQGKTENEFRGWWNRAKEKGLNYNGGEIYNWVKEYYPELLKFCVNKSYIRYEESDESFDELKSKMIEEKKLIISKEKTYRGKIEASMYAGKEEISIMQHYQTSNKKTGDVSIGYRFLDEPKVSKGVKILKTLSVNFYIDTFTDGKGNSYLLFSEKKLDRGSCMVVGSEIKLPDDVLIGNYGKVESRKKIIFCYEVEPYIRKYKAIDEIFSTFNYSKQQLLDFLFYHEREKRVYYEPEYLNNLILSFLLASKRSYQMHLLINGPPHCGKTSLLEAVSDKFDEDNLDSGSGSTIKGLVPSFGQATPKVGALLNANRLCFIDEFFGNVHSERKNSNNQDSDNLRMMNEILECRSRRYGSGKGVIDNAVMKAKLFGVTNPIEGTTFLETIKIIPETVVERILIINLGKNMSEWVNNSEIQNFKEGKPEPFVDKFIWLGIYDFFNTFTSKFDDKRILNIIKKIEQKVPIYLREAYNKRYKNHHIQCLMDGIIKTRCLFEKNKFFEAIEADYVELEKLWDSVIVNWNEDNKILTNEQLKMVEIIKEKGKILIIELKEICKQRNIDYEYNKNVLDNAGLIKPVDKLTISLTEDFAPLGAYL